MNEVNQLPTLLDVLDEIALKEELVALDNSPPWNLLLHTQHVADKFEVAQRGPNHYILSPIPLLFNTFYRGENSVHDHSKASIYRKGISDVDRFIERIKACELGLLIDLHPLSHIYRNGITLPLVNNEKVACNLVIDHFALAQHYEIKTDLIDFTSDKWVAAFFAATEKKDGKYYPIEDNRRTGAFYIHNPLPFDIGLENFNEFRPVGLQPFSRPGEQKGFVLQLNEQDNLNEISRTKIHFRHDKNVSHLIYNYSNRANKLFPKDILDNKAELIKKSTVFSKESLKKAKEIFYPEVDSKSWESLITISKLSFQDCPITSFSTDETDEFLNRWEKSDKYKFMDQIVYRKVFFGN